MLISSKKIPADLMLIINQMQEHIKSELNPIWAIRNLEGKFLFTSDSYTLAFTDNMTSSDYAPESLSIDKATIDNILLLDKDVLEKRSTIISPEVFIHKGVFMIEEVVRYPLFYNDQIVAIGILINPVADLHSLLIKYKTYNRKNLIKDDSLLNMKPRDKLIGVFVLLDLSLKQMASLLKISTTRVSSILHRICRSKYDVEGGGQSYREQLVSRGIYKQFIWEVFHSEYSDMLLNAFTISLENRKLQ